LGSKQDHSTPRTVRHVIFFSLPVFVSLTKWYLTHESGKQGSEPKGKLQWQQRNLYLYYQNELDDGDGDHVAASVTVR
jgi:hypothetical protein